MFVHRLVGISRNKPLRTCILLIGFIALTLLALFLTSLRPTDIRMKSTGGSIPINFPLKEHSNLPDQQTKEYDLTGKLDASFLSQHIVNITADGCIKYLQVNGVAVTRDKIVHGENCDSTNGFDIDLAKYLRRDTNTFQMALIDSGSWLGLSIKNSHYDGLYRVLTTILILEITALLYFFLKNCLRFSEGIVLLIVLGVLLRILYLGSTPYSVRTYDVLELGGHLDYIQYVANHFQLPKPDMDYGWEYHQAPLYYVTAALVYKISQVLVLDYQSLLQILSLVYFTVFLIFGVLILQLFCKSKWLFFTSTALFVFWPSGIIHSIRLGNDVMYYMVSVIGLYFLIQWILGKQDKHFYLATLFIALAVTTKLSGMIWLAILACFFVMHILKKKHLSAYLRKTLFLIGVVGCALCLSLGRNSITALHDSNFNVINGNAAYTINEGLSVGNTLHNYLYFDLNTYLTRPFTSTWTNAGGRQYFWNFSLKSMLFGEFSFSSPTAQFFATVLSALLLQMILFFFIGFILSLQKLSLSHLLLIFWLILSLLSLASFRYTLPFAPNADFRYIFPVLIPFIYFYVSGIHCFIQRKLAIIGVCGYILAYVFVAASCLFFIIPLWMPGN